MSETWVRSARAIDWDSVYVAHATRLRRLIARRVQPVLVEDVLQETFLRAFRGRNRFDAGRPIAPWLTTIAMRAAADAYPGLGQCEALDVFADPGHASAEDEFTRREERRDIAAALASLSRRQRRLIEQVHVEGRTQSEVARVDGVPPTAVRAATTRARKRFRTTYLQLNGAL